jgi:IS5 family transposase
MMRKRNWSKYNKSLVQRGSITFWIDENFLKNSEFQEPTKGRPKYKSSIIHMGWILKTAYHLTFRSLEGYFNSLLSLIGVDIACPNYTLFCKRGKEVAELLPKLTSRKPLEIVVDASGLKIYGEGEWKTFKHGRDKKRRWIKVHVGVDPKSGECLSISITDERKGDSSQFSDLIKRAPKSIRKAYADGAYDTVECRKLLFERGIEDVIPPRKTSKLRKEKELRNRNDGVKELRGLGGDYQLWKLLKGYGRRSLAETFFSRLKLLFGERLSCKKFTNQNLEVLLRVFSLNKMAKATYSG